MDLITPTEIYSNFQSTTFAVGNPDNPVQILVAYNDSRGLNATPINISGASWSTDGGNTFVRLTGPDGQSPFSGMEGDPVALYHLPTQTWLTIWLDPTCGSQGFGGYKTTTPADVTSWTHFCIHNGTQDDRESGWTDNSSNSQFYGNMYVSYNNFAIGGGALYVTRSTDGGLTWRESDEIPVTSTSRDVVPSTGRIPAKSLRCIEPRLSQQNSAQLPARPKNH